MPKLPDQFVTAPGEKADEAETTERAPARSEKTLRSTTAPKTTTRAAKKPASKATKRPAKKAAQTSAEPPAAEPASTPAARPRSASLLRDPSELRREVLVRLTEDEHRALEAARAELGGTVSLEQMLHRVLADWLARRAPEARVDVARMAERVVAQLRRLARDPLGTWRHLGRAVRRATLRAAS